MRRQPVDRDSHQHQHTATTGPVRHGCTKPGRCLLATEAWYLSNRATPRPLPHWRMDGDRDNSDHQCRRRMRWGAARASVELPAPLQSGNLQDLSRNRQLLWCSCGADRARRPRPVCRDLPILDCPVPTPPRRRHRSKSERLDDHPLVVARQADPPRAFAGTPGGALWRRPVRNLQLRGETHRSRCQSTGERTMNTCVGAVAQSNRHCRIWSNAGEVSARDRQRQARILAGQSARPTVLGSLDETAGKPWCRRASALSARAARSSR